MPRPRKSASPFDGVVPPNLMSWAESLGEALGRGMARGLNSLVALAPLANGNGARRRGRPPKAFTGGPVPQERRCKADGCPREMRSKGLCSAHYQAERRRQLQKSGAKA
jgi:hypothetical protein